MGVPPEFQPDASSARFDLERALSAVVALRADVPEDAFTASILGTERGGNGVVIRDDGLVLTIGYLITEAETFWLTTHDGRVVARASARLRLRRPASGWCSRWASSACAARCAGRGRRR